MAINDPIADMLTRIRNAVMSGQTLVAMPSSKIKIEIAKIMKDEGYLEGFEMAEGEDQPQNLKYQRIARSALFLIFIGMVIGGNSLVQRRQVRQLELQTQATLQVQATHTADWIQQTKATQNALATQQAFQTQQVQATQYAQATAQAQQGLREKLIVVIATFEGPEEVYGLRNEIIESLNSSFSQDEEVEIVTVNDVVTPDMGSSYARHLGEQLFADLVIWGWYRPTENNLC